MTGTIKIGAWERECKESQTCLTFIAVIPTSLEDGALFYAVILPFFLNPRPQKPGGFIPPSGALALVPLLSSTGSHLFEALALCEGTRRRPVQSPPGCGPRGAQGGRMAGADIGCHLMSMESSRHAEEYGESEAQELESIAGTSGGNKATKKKAPCCHFVMIINATLMRASSAWKGPSSLWRALQAARLLSFHRKVSPALASREECRANGGFGGQEGQKGP